MIFLYNINYIRASDQTAQVLRLSSAPYKTKRTDTPSNVKYDDRLKVGGSMSRYMFGFGKTIGQSEIGAGSIIAANGDGVLDSLKDDGFDFQQVDVYTVKSERTAFADAVLFATFIIEKPVFRWNEVEFNIRDPLFLLKRPIQDSLFAGGNGASTTGIEGNDDDIKGQKKPVTIGKCFHVPLTLMNTTTLLYGCHHDKNGNTAALTFSDIYDRALALVDDGDDADIATLAAAATPFTQDYRTCEAVGVARLESTPEGIVTADVVEGATAADRTAAQCVKRAITNYAIGFTPSFDNATFTALDTADNSEVGVYSTGDDTLFELCAALLGSIDAALLVNKNLEFFVKQLVDPATVTATETIVQNDIVKRGQGLEGVQGSDDDNGVPSYQTTTLFKHYFHRFSESDLAATLTDEQRNDALQQWRRTAAATTASVQNVYKSSRALEIASYLIDSAAASTRNTARHNLRKVARSLYVLSLERSTALEIGDVIELKIPRFGMNSGKNFLVLGYDWQEITEPIVDYLIYG